MRLILSLCLAAALGIAVGALLPVAFVLGVLVGEDMGQAAQGCGVDVVERVR